MKLIFTALLGLVFFLVSPIEIGVDTPIETKDEVSRSLDRTSEKESENNLTDYVEVTATAYTHTGNRTFTGTWPAAGRTVAVDPNVIPLGTRVYIEGYGWRVAEDTGGLIKGHKIDLFFDSEIECINFGVQKLRVRWEVN